MTGPFGMFYGPLQCNYGLTLTPYARVNDKSGNQERKLKDFHLS